MTPKKMGRPTENPKGTQISVRFDEPTLEKLDAFCESEGVTRPEGVRRAVQKLPEKK